MRALAPECHPPAQLSETRSNGSVSRPTLMHYMVDLVDSSFPDLAKFPEDLAHVAEGHRGTVWGRARAMVHR